MCFAGNLDVSFNSLAQLDKVKTVKILTNRRIRSTFKDITQKNYGETLQRRILHIRNSKFANDFRMIPVKTQNLENY